MALAGIKRFSIVGAIATSVVFAAYDGWLFFLARTPGKLLSEFYSVVLSTLLAIWVVTDARAAHRAQPSFDYEWFVLLGFPVYVPYYLVSTRRWRRGLLICVGMLVLFLLPSLAELIAIFVS